MAIMAETARRDLARFLWLLLALLAAQFLAAAAIRVAAGDTGEAAATAVTALALGGSAAALVGTALVAVAAAPLRAALGAAGCGMVLMCGSAIAVPLVLPEGVATLGPAAMGLMLPALVWPLAAALGLPLRLLTGLLVWCRRRHRGGVTAAPGPDRPG